MELEMYPLIYRRITVATLLLAGLWSYSALASPADVASQTSVASYRASQLKRGDLVRLRSGGPMMTVSDIKGNQINCFWTDLNGQPDDASFPSYVLQKF
jgi:uncharacterized protein YodC (DUF2158 family)